ncbi:MAG: serine/threonine-protein kinase PknK [Myxococcales bacterium]
MPETLELGEMLYESERTVVHRARERRGGRPVILKVLKSDCPSWKDVDRFKREFAITKGLQLAHVIHPWQLEVIGNRPSIALEDFGGTSLNRLMPGNSWTLAEKLRIAIAIAEGIDEIHSRDIIHKDINPSNIVFNPQTHRLKLIDFGIATVLAREQPVMASAVTECTLEYASPEQTGRTNRPLDCRTDFYSFGVTLYELLAGRLPFSGGDALELVHQHLTQPPVPVHEIDPSIPPLLSEVVAKLLAKSPEDRYQSAWGIKVDLERCLAELTGHQRIEPFALGQQDVPQWFHLSPKLYGRDGEVAELLAAFDRISRGARELVLIGGYSGIGKTALVQELFRPLAERRGYFVSGKFDQLQRNTPFSALAKALQDLVRQLLIESDARLRVWRGKLAAALGPHGQLMVNMVPELELIIGPQPPVPELSPAEAQNRFSRVFQQFVSVFYPPEHPLLIFLDDLQWVDHATLTLLENLVSDEETHHLLVVGAYRDNEVGDSHPLPAMVERLAKAGAPTRHLSLQPLGQAALARFVADTLGCEVARAMPLTELVEAKTGGNPFFVGQFLTTLHQEGLLRFAPFREGAEPRRGWRWDLERIRQAGLTDNVVDLMVRKLRKLPATTVEMLKLAACLGHQFDLRTLALVAERPGGDTYASLAAAIHEGMAVPISLPQSLERGSVGAPLVYLHYRFQHDRVQQAAYGLIEQQAKTHLHLRIGRLLLAHTKGAARSERLFEVVDHLNLGQALMSDPAERVELARLNLEAARRAKRAAAFDSALRYLQGAMEAFAGDWSGHYALTHALHRERAELEYLNGNHARSDELIEAIWARAGILDRAEAYTQLVTAQTLQGKNEEAIAAADKALGLLGFRFPSEGELPRALEEELARVERGLEGRSVASLIDLPPMADGRVTVAMKLLMTAHTPAFFANQYPLYTWILARMTSLSMEFGNVPESSKGYASFGNALAASRGRYQAGYEFGLLGLRLAEKYGDESLKCKACLILSMFLNHWVRPIGSGDALDEEGQRAGLQTGELQFVGYILAFGRTVNRFHAGEDLGHLVAEVRKSLAFTRKAQHTLATDYLLGMLLVLSNLVGATRDLWSFEADSLREASYLRSCQDNKSFGAICFYGTVKAFALYLLGDSAAALACIEEAAPLLGYVKGQLTEAEHNFYHSLILAEACSTASDDARKSYRQKLEANQRQMKVWADHCPANFLHKFQLVAAEIARLDQDTLGAMTLFDQAIASTGANGFRQNQALANELAGRFWLAKGKPHFADLYLRNALEGYRAWGARRRARPCARPTRSSSRTGGSRRRSEGAARSSRTGCSARPSTSRPCSRRTRRSLARSSSTSSWTAC